MESWQSGRMRYLGKVVMWKRIRGFESLTLRHKLFNKEEYLLYLFVVFFLFLFLPLTIVEGNESNLVILQAKEIISLEHEERFQNAIVIENDRIKDTGSFKQLQIKYPKSTLDKRFKDKIIVPGFIEHHVHPFLAAITMQSEIIAIEDWVLPNKESKGVTDRKSYLKRLTNAVEQFEANEPFVSWGFHHYFHGKLSREDLDKISNEKPILVIHRSFHEFIMNTPALKYFGITKEWIDNLDEEAKAFADFENGHFSEQGLVSVIPVTTPFLASPQRLIAGLQATEKHLHENGVTLIANPGSSNVKPIQDAKNFVFGDTDTPFRSFYFPSALTLSEKYPVNELVDQSRKFLDWGQGKLEYLPQHIKLFTDGAMFSQNMIMSEGYLDGHQGAWLMQENLFRDVFKEFWDENYQIHIHQNGDGGLKVLLDVLEENIKRNPREDHRTTIVHFGYSNFDQVQRIKELGAIVSANPYYVTTLSDLYSRVGVGAERSQEMVRLGDVNRAGIPIGLHSDMPMAPASPLLLMHSAVNRINFADKVAGPNQRISPESALRAVTIDAAYILGLEDEVGSIVKGKLANLTILSENPMKVDPGKIKDIEVIGTIAEGRYFPIHK